VDFFANGAPLASQVFSTTSFSLEVMKKWKVVSLRSTYEQQPGVAAI
jgi:hypothetical protein